MKKKRSIFLISLLVLVGIQFIPVNYSNPAVDPSKNFVDIYHAPSSVKQTLQNACYDCHSNETKYPWYSYVAPVSWMLKNHIDEGREHLNFSEFGNYKPDNIPHILDECTELVKKRDMPLRAYVLMHRNAKLSDEQEKELVGFFQQIKDSASVTTTN